MDMFNLSRPIEHEGFEIWRRKLRPGKKFRTRRGKRNWKLSNIPTSGWWVRLSVDHKRKRFWSDPYEPNDAVGRCDFCNQKRRYTHLVLHEQVSRQFETCDECKLIVVDNCLNLRVIASFDVFKTAKALVQLIRENGWRGPPADVDYPCEGSC